MTTLCRGASPALQSTTIAWSLLAQVPGHPTTHVRAEIELSADVSLVMDPAKIVSSKAPKAVRMELLSPCWKGTPLIVTIPNNCVLPFAIQICQKHYFQPNLKSWPVGLEYNFLDERDYYFGHVCNPQSSNPNHRVGIKRNSGYCNPERRALLEGHTSCILVWELSPEIRKFNFFTDCFKTCPFAFLFVNKDPPMTWSQLFVFHLQKLEERHILVEGARRFRLSSNALHNTNA